MQTPRLEVRLPREQDRARFVELFASDEFMVFAGALDSAGANTRFDAMLARAHEVPFAKQPVIEQASGVIVGYTGVDRFVYDGNEWLEYGCRLVTTARGKGYATEAGQALLTAAAQTFEGTLLGMVDSDNHPSQRVIAKLGFSFWKQDRVAGRRTHLYRLALP
jgi:RimJ/RimL family protein N-acetyltransferase